MSNRIQLPNGAEILFRELNDPVASWSVPGCRWVVEYWGREACHPCGQAWVFVTDCLVYVDWLEVMPRFQRKGIATALMDAIQARWPEVSYDGATDAGRAFVEAYDEGEEA